MLSLPLIIGAFGAGLGMFFAPCTLPIVPGYLAFIAGGRTAGRQALLRNACAFVLGFSLVFILLGIFASAIGAALGAYRLYVPQVAGAVIMLFGLTMLGLRIPGLGTEHRLRLPAFVRVGTTPSSAFIGALFALGWSPCIGPILGTVLLIASSSATTLEGALLLTVFSAGLALPFILCALLMERAEPLIARFAALTSVFNTFSACVLIALGFLMLMGKAGLLVQWGFALFGPWYQSLLNYL